MAENISEKKSQSIFIILFNACTQSDTGKDGVYFITFIPQGGTALLQPGGNFFVRLAVKVKV
jgi:hypothetical protein